MEHRWGSRQDLNRIVHIGTRGGVIARGKLRDVSLSGAFVQSDLPVALLGYVKIQFVGISRGQRLATQIEGQVVRKNRQGFGVEWLEFAPDGIGTLTAAAFREAASYKGNWTAVRRRHHVSHVCSAK